MCAITCLGSHMANASLAISASQCRIHCRHMLPNPHGSSDLLKCGLQRCSFHSSFIVFELFSIDSLWVSALQETVARKYVLYNFGFRKSGIFSVRICISYWTLLITHLFSLSLSSSLSLKLFDPDRHFLSTPRWHALESYRENHIDHLCPS